MVFDRSKRPEGFDAPTALPRDDAEAARWQEANRKFWEATPMSYDWREDAGAYQWTPEFFDEIDRRFLESARKFLPWKNRPFDALIPFDELPRLDVLEIGVGLGTHAQLIAPHAKSYTGIDLTDRAIGATTARLAHRGITVPRSDSASSPPGSAPPRVSLLRMDAEQMAFPDASFDFIWSWGVIHHSSNTRRILEHMHRVLRPGGRATVMVYHRSAMRVWVTGALLRGVLLGEFLKGRTLHQITQDHTDGAIARYYKPREWAAFVGDLFHVERQRVYGMKEEVPIPGGRIKSALLKAVPDSVTRLGLNTLRQGSMLVAEMRKK